MEFVFEEYDPPFRIRYPKGFKKWINDTLDTAIIYNRWKKIAHCKRCGYTWDYQEPIHKDDIKTCPCCHGKIVTIPHTCYPTSRYSTYIFFWNTKNALCFAEIEAHWSYLGGDVDKEKDITTISLLTCGKISEKEQHCFCKEFSYKKSRWAMKETASSHLSNMQNHVTHINQEQILTDSWLKYKDPLFTEPKLLIKELAFVAKYPSAEYVIKTGFSELVKYAINRYQNTYIRPNWRAKTLSGVLRIKAQDVDKLRAWDALTVEKVAIYKKILAVRKKPKEEDLNLVSKYFQADELYERKSLYRSENIVAKGDVVRTARYLNKVCKKYYESKSYQTKSEYKDYLLMLEELGYPLDDDYYRYPKNLKEAHDRIVGEYNARRDALRKEKEKLKEKKYIEEFLPKLESYEYADSEYLIRPLKSSKDFRDEGMNNHNCVASYQGRAFRGEAKIFVLRKNIEPDKSYVTIELAMDNSKILQCYASGNTIPTDEIKQWVDKWHKEIVLNKSKDKLKRIEQKGDQLLCQTA